MLIVLLYSDFAQYSRGRAPPIGVIVFRLDSSNNGATPAEFHEISHSITEAWISIAESRICQFIPIASIRVFGTLGTRGLGVIYDGSKYFRKGVSLRVEVKSRHNQHQTVPFVLAPIEPDGRW